MALSAPFRKAFLSLLAMSDANLNADLTKRVLMRTSTMDWVRSGATATVERKRCFRAGGQESGAVTSVVRYLPGASFPTHPHPQGEEIFVLNGVFSDKRGDHGSGVLLLNPEGFEHAPSSKEGNEILVRLRQYPNAVPSALRSQMAIDSNKLEWEQDVSQKGVTRKTLYPPNDESQKMYPERQWLEQWAKDANPLSSGTVEEDGMEMFVVEGSFQDADGDYVKGDWLRLPPGYNFSERKPGSEGCVLLCKSGGAKYAIPQDVE